MLWKVYNIETGKVLKAGFESEDDAKDWLEERSENLADDYVVDEMDADEIEEWNEENEEEEAKAEAHQEEEEDDGYYEEDDEAEESDEESLEDLYEEEDDDDI